MALKPFSFTFKIVDDGSQDGIVIMQAWLMKDDDEIRALPIMLTVQELGHRLVGELTLLTENHTQWVEEETEDDFFGIADDAVARWLFDRSWPYR